MLTPRRQASALLLCLLLRNVHSQFEVYNEYTVDGTAKLNATLPCSLTIPSNWKDDQIQVMWFKNFTEKLWDCTMKIEEEPDCLPSPKSSQTQISRNHFGDVALEISELQESDAGRYQCWIIMSDTFLRKNVLLRVHRPHSHGLGMDNSAQLIGSVVTASSWTIVLQSGWLVTIFLAAVLLLQRLCVSKRKSQTLLTL